MWGLHQATSCWLAPLKAAHHPQPAWMVKAATATMMPFWWSYRSPAQEPTEQPDLGVMDDPHGKCGKRLLSYGLDMLKSPFMIGKSPFISCMICKRTLFLWVIFSSYVTLPEGQRSQKNDGLTHHGEW